MTDASCALFPLTIAHLISLNMDPQCLAQTQRETREVLRIHDLAVLQCATSNCSRERDGVVCIEVGELIIGRLKK